MASRRCGEQTRSATGYPRTCGDCGHPFLARRSTARFCSDVCRLRSWRHASREADVRDVQHLRRQVRQLRSALAEITATNPCAAAGCLNAPGPRNSNPPVWRTPEWNEPIVRTVRSRLSEVRRDVDRLRAENVVLRRWIHQHRDGRQ